MKITMDCVYPNYNPDGLNKILFMSIQIKKILNLI